MYGLPDDLDLSFLEGRTLLQLCVGSHDLILNFDEGVSILITSSIGYEANSGRLLTYKDLSQASQGLFPLLGKKTTKAGGSKSGTLSLGFEDQSRLEIYDDSTQYESYVITHAGGQVIV